MMAHTQFLLPIGRRWLFYAPLQSTAALLNGAAARALRERRLDLLPARDRAAFEAIVSDPLRDVAPRNGSLAPTMLGIVPTRGCNMACSYCNFEGPSSAMVTMPLHTATAAVDWAAQQLVAAGMDSLSVQFFGGEPFVARDVVETVVHRARAVAAQQGLTVRFDASSNGNYGPATCRFIADHFDSIVLSLDGPADIQDRNRPLAPGRGSSTVVERTARLLSESSVELCLRMCVTHESVERMEQIVRWMIDRFDPNSINLETLTPGPLAEKAGLRPPDPYAFARGAMACLHVARAMGVELSYSAALSTAPRKTFCPVGSDAAIVLPDGAIASCYLQPDEWLARGMELRYGRIDDAGQVSINGAALQRVRELPAHKPRCAGCFCRFGCAGGCHVNQTYPGCSSAYTDFCIQTRVLTACRLLQEIGADDAAEALVGDAQAMAVLAVRADEGLPSNAAPLVAEPPAARARPQPASGSSSGHVANGPANPGPSDAREDAQDGSLPRLAQGIRWVVDTRGVSVFEASGDRHELAYPQAAVWTLLARGCGRRRLLRLLPAIAGLDETNAAELLSRSIVQWSRDGWLDPLTAMAPH